jgi:methyl-accepting chemotaxis protein
MVFVGNAIGWDVSNVNFVLTSLASLVILFYGAGCWSDDPNCCDGSCETPGTDLGKIAGVGAVIGAGTQLLDSVKDKVGDVANLDGLNTLKDKATDMLGSTGGLIEGAKDLITNNDMVQNIADKAGSMVEMAQDHVESISEKVMDLGDKAKEIANTAADYVPGMEAVADKVEAAVDFVQDKVEDAKDMVASAADKIDDTVEIIDADSKKA